MSGLSIQSIDDPQETRKFVAHGHLDLVTFGGYTFGRGTFEPGWKWSNDVKPIAGTDSCQVRHFGICASGRMIVRMDDGTESPIGPGDVFAIEPGHDAWTVSDEPCVLYDAAGIDTYAKPS